MFNVLRCTILYSNVLRKVLKKKSDSALNLFIEEYTLNTYVTFLRNICDLLDMYTRNFTRMRRKYMKVIIGIIVNAALVRGQSNTDPARSSANSATKVHNGHYIR